MQVEMSIKGLMVDPITNMPIVILHDSQGQRILPIWVGLFEANAINDEGRIIAVGTIEPVLTISLAALIGVVLLAIYLPMFDMISTMS